MDKRKSYKRRTEQLQKIGDELILLKVDIDHSFHIIFEKIDKIMEQLHCIVTKSILAWQDGFPSRN